MGDVTNRWSVADLAFIDVEGNGQARQEIIELAIVHMVKGSIQETGKTWLVRPMMPITDRALAIHGISNATVELAPNFPDISMEIRQELLNIIVVGHRVDVDCAILCRQMPDWSPIAALDTWKLARAVLPNESTYSLSALCRAYVATKTNKLIFHSARDDAVATAHLFSYLMGILDPSGGMNISRLMEICGTCGIRPPTYGKQERIFE